MRVRWYKESTSEQWVLSGAKLTCTIDTVGAWEQMVTNGNKYLNTALKPSGPDVARNLSQFS